MTFRIASLLGSRAWRTLLTCFVFGYSLHPYTLLAASGLVAAYSFDESSGTIVSDSSGNGNNGTVANATWSSGGKFGDALMFNGSSARVTIPDAASLHLTSGMTLEAWVMPSAVTSAWRDVIYKGNDNYYLESTSSNSSRPAGGGTWGSTGIVIYGSSKLTVNTWAHLALTYDGANLRLYVNGTQVASQARTGTIATSANPLQIGGDSIYGQYFKGTIDEIRVYNLALTAEQIQSDMNTPVGTPIPDTQPPSAPANLTANAVSQSQINLTWTASTDNVGVTGYLIERCQGAGCNNFAQITTVTGTSFNDTSLAVATSYSYQVRATDAAANLSPYSNVASATTQAPDTQPPTTPASLIATAISGTQINLSWTASTDNVGVTGYLIERCQGAGCSNFAQIGTVAGTTYSDLSLALNTSYTYQLRATDAAGNFSNYSNTATAITLTTIPGLVAAYSFDEGSGTTVSDSSGTGNNGTVANTTWSSAGKFGGALMFNGSSARVTIPDAASLHLTTGMTLEAWVKPSTVNSAWRDVIYKGNDNYYLEGTSSNGSVPAGGGTGSSTLYGPTALTPNTWTHLALTYDASVLRLYVNGVQVSSLVHAGTLATSTNALQIGGDNIYGQYFNGVIDEVRVYNIALTAAQIQSDMNTPVGTPIPDTQPPTVPANLTATAVSQSRINLSWTASTDNVGVTGYLIERCQGAGCNNLAQITTVTGTSFNDTGLATGTSYSYQVRATDAAANLSPYSNVASATTQAPDIQPPTTPTGLTATAVSGSRINLSWTASTDNVGVTGYSIERCQGAGCNNFARVTTVAVTTYSDNALVSNTSYTYQVKATDATGNFSNYSNTATATTLATISGLVAAYSFDEGSGITVTDLSGQGHTGTIANATWTSVGKYGNTLVFNGSNARVTVPDAASLHFTAGMTLEAWVNPSIVNSSWRDVIYKGNDNYYLEGTSTNGSVPAGGGTWSSTVYSSAPLTANTWTHLALTYDASVLRFYVNGVQVAGITQTGNITTSTNPLQIGGDSIYGQYFAGMIDEIRVYNVALTQAQIQSDMATPVGAGGPLPLVSLSSLNLTFGNQATGTSSAAQPVTLTNVGGAQLTIGSITIASGNAGDFAQTNNCGAALQPNAFCTMNVTFTPSSTGARASTLTITDNAPGNPHSVALSGTGAGFSVMPRTSVLTFTQTQQFAAGGGSVTWLVDGAVGGSPSSGTITASGLYTPPSTAGMHVVTATTLDQAQSAGATVYVSNYAGTFTYRNDNLRSGSNTNETVLAPGGVNYTQFGKLFSCALDGIAFASPVYVSNVNIPGQGYRNVVYIATEHDSVYAFDADGLSAAPLWKVSFLGSGIAAVPCGDTGECGDIPNEIGVTGTPVIDQATGTLYVVSKVRQGSQYHQHLHALDIATGAEKFGGPVSIQAGVTGSGAGSQGGQVAFNALRENQRPALLLSNGIVYIAWAAHGDQPPWHGWVIGYNAATLQQVMVYNVSPDGYGGGIWQSGAGVAADTSGNLFFVTGNGDFTANSGGRDYGDSILKLSPSGGLVDYFTPHDQALMESGNYDLSSSGPVLLVDQPGPRPHMLIMAAKTGTIYVIDRDNMGHFNFSSDNQIIQALPGALLNGGPEEGNYSASLFFNNTVYFAAVNDTLKAFQLTGGVLSGTPASQSSVSYPNRGGSFAVSANGNTNGILWSVQDNSPSGGILRAYDAADLSHELYNTTQAGSRDSLGSAAKFSIPTVANGRVFVVAQTQLVVYGLLP